MCREYFIGNIHLVLIVSKSTSMAYRDLYRISLINSRKSEEYLYDDEIDEYSFANKEEKALLVKLKKLIL